MLNKLQAIGQMSDVVKSTDHAQQFMLKARQAISGCFGAGRYQLFLINDFSWLTHALRLPRPLRKAGVLNKRSALNL